MAEPGPVKLRMEDAEDLTIVSAHVQDALARVGDLHYHPGLRRFVIMMNRFRWERARRGPLAWLRPAERVRAGLHFEGVLAARLHGIRQDRPDALLSLLALRFEPGEPPGGTISLVFSGDGVVRLTVECIGGALADVSPPWPARRRPRHAAGSAER